MTGDVSHSDFRVALANRFDRGNEMPVLLIGVRRIVLTFELDTDAKIVAGRSATKTRVSRVPGAPAKRDKLRYFTVTTDQQVR
jgi:hypothetical protein